MEYDGSVQQSLFSLLVLLSITYAVIQVIIWTGFALTPLQVTNMCPELQEQYNCSNHKSFDIHWINKNMALKILGKDVTGIAWRMLGLLEY